MSRATASPPIRNWLVAGSGLEHQAARHHKRLVGMELPGIRLKQARIHAVTELQCVATVREALRVREGGWIVTMNLDHLRRYALDPAYVRYQSEATIVLADGMPLIWASRLQGTPLPERVTGSNLIWTLSAMAAEEHRSVFLLGGNPGTGDRAAEVLRHQFPHLNITGTYCPPLHFEEDKRESLRVVEAVTRNPADIIYVALGSPKQEQVIAGLRHHLDCSWWMGVGIAFSFVAGEMPRAPLWMQQSGLEWLHRLTHDPRRLANRYLVQGLPFAVGLFASAALQRLQAFAR